MYVFWTCVSFSPLALTSEKQKTLREYSIAEEIWIAQVVHRFFRYPVREVAKVPHHYLLDQIQVANLERRSVSQENGGAEEPVWLQDGYSQIFRSYVFGPSGFWTMAPLRYAAKFDPFLSLDCAPTPSTLAQSKERKGSNGNPGYLERRFCKPFFREFPIVPLNLQVRLRAPPDRLQHVDERPARDPEAPLQVLRPRPPSLSRLQHSKGEHHKVEIRHMYIHHYFSVWTKHP